MKRYDAYKSTGIPWIPEVPEHWEMRKLRHFIEMISEKNHPQEPLLSVVRDQGVILRDITSKEENHNAIPDDLSGYKLIEKGHFAINKMKAWQGSYGVSNYRGIVSPAYYTCRLNFEYKAFFNLAIRSDAYVPFFTQYSKGIRVGQWDLSPIGLKEIPFFLPPLSEQRAIVAYVERKGRQIDAYIARQAEQIERLKELRQTIISHAVTRGIHPYTRFRPTGIPWIPEVPEHWEVRKSTRIFPRIGSGTTPKTGVQGYYTEDNGIYWLQTGDLNDGLIEDTAKKITRRALDESNLNIYPIGSVVIAMYGATIGKVGLLNIEAATNQACCVLPPSPHYISKYAISVFMSVKTELIRQALGGGQPNISQETIRRIRLPLPPLSEQRAIVAYIEKKTAAIDRMINACREQMELMKAYKQRLISDAVTGRIRVLEK